MDDTRKTIAEGHVNYINGIVDQAMVRFGERVPTESRAQYFIYMMNEFTLKFMGIEKENGR